MSEENKNKEILEERHLKEDPFIVPQGYFDTLENSVGDKVAMEKEKTRGIWYLLKPAVGLAASFALIFGIGYGVMNLTGSYSGSDNTTVASNAQKPADTSVVSDEDVLNTILYENGYEATAQIMEQPDSPSGDEIEEYLINSDISTASLVAMEQSTIK